ncbi:sigma-70 family RNA polymerase sigma factor, partial [Flavonifractor plautii]
MTRVFIWKNNSPQEWEEISFSAFSKARRNGCFT